VTRWIGDLQAGDPAAAQKLWERYFAQLVTLASGKLRGAPRGAADEEDVALSAFDSFFGGVRRGRFPQLHDRDNLWRLLVVITARKVLDLRNRERRQKRGGGAVLGEAALVGTKSEEFTLDQIIGPEPTPQFAVEVAEECRRRLDSLEDAQLVKVALWKMEGFTNEEIAAKLGCVTRTVERKIQVIRSIWGEDLTL
jgi:DNA-directed RNA polymerase specialized sigma24 family protein